MSQSSKEVELKSHNSLHSVPTPSCQEPLPKPFFTEWEPPCWTVTRMQRTEPETSSKILGFRVLEIARVSKVKILHTLAQITH